MPDYFVDTMNLPQNQEGESNAAEDAHMTFTQVQAERNLARSMEQVDALLYTHPDYDANLDKWMKYIDLYSAEDISRFLYKHEREHQDSYANRLKRCYFYNYVASVVDLFVSYLFSVDITREDATDEGLKQEIQDVLKDADLRGTSYDVMIRTAATLSQVFGWTGVLVDAPRQTAQIMSEHDRKEQNIRPFLKIVTPLDLLDWEVDELGKFVWVKIEVPVSDERTFNQKADGMERRFVIWTRESWELWQVVETPGGHKEAKLIDGGESPTNVKGIVPLALLRNIKKLTHEWMGESAIRDISDINVALLNWSSLGDEEIANRCLNILTMERDNMQQNSALIGHANVLEYASGAKPPEFLTPGVTPLELIGKWIDRARDEIYRIAKLGGSTGLLGVREATSGIAYAYEFNETNQSLTAKASFMEVGETEIFQLIARWMGKEYDGTVTYSRDFGVDDFLLELDTIMKARVALTSETAIRQVEKNVLLKAFARKPLEFRKKIEKEVDAAEAIPLPVESFDTASPALTRGAAG